MAAMVLCLKCGDESYATDPRCMSCGAVLIGVGPVDAAAVGAMVEADNQRNEQAYMHRAMAASPATRQRGRQASHRRRRQRVESLIPQAKGLIAQGYHRLPAAPGEMRGPAEDLSDLCRDVGECYYKNDNFEEAVKWCGEALTINELNTMARCYVVGALCELERYDLARAWYDETPGDIADKNAVHGWLEEPDDEPEDDVVDSPPEPVQGLRDGTDS
ncbi:MAG TPA: tetratricopeptide repeat protein [Armatimonadota bacterium]|nr:tetratricopeptide repeat protein [Armatimonadota bacterium]